MTFSFLLEKFKAIHEEVYSATAQTRICLEIYSDVYVSESNQNYKQSH